MMLPGPCSVPGGDLVRMEQVIPPFYVSKQYATGATEGVYA